MTATITDVLDYISGTATEAEVDTIFREANTRIRTLRERRALAVTVGAEVTLVDISPKYLAGLTGTVESINGARATVLLDETSTRRLRTVRRSRFYVGMDVERYTMDGVPMSACKAV